jgi:hypothetical protein
VDRRGRSCLVGGGVIGRSVTLLTTVTTYFSSGEASGCGTEGQERCSTLSLKYVFETHSSASSFYPIILRVEGIYRGRPFRGSYHMPFQQVRQLSYIGGDPMRLCSRVSKLGGGAPALLIQSEIA